MIYEWRTYGFAPGDAVTYLARFQSEGLPLVTAHLPLLGYWLTDAGELNTLHHLWVYKDLADRAARRARLAADVAWTAGFTPRAVLPLVKTQRSWLLSLVSGSALLEQAVAGAGLCHDARVGDAPPLAESHATLTVTPEPVADEGADMVARWRVVAGQAPGRCVALRRFDRAEAITFTEGERCDLLRPAAFSPL